MKLIDAEKLQKQFDLKSTNPNYRVNMHNIKSIITNAHAIEAIPKADYEARLKADMVAMLIELKNKLIDKSWNIDMYDDDLDFECCYLTDIDEIIQQKIDKLRGEEDGKID